MKSDQELNSLALQTRRGWNEDGYSPIDIFGIVNGWKEKNITILRYPLSDRISGMCTRVDNVLIQKHHMVDRDLRLHMNYIMYYTKI